MLLLADVIEALTNIRPAEESTIITEAAVDSRQVIPGGLFVALPGRQADGHDFVTQAFARGASFALIQHEVEGYKKTISLQRDVPTDLAREAEKPLCLKVDNTLSALQQLARYWRKKLDLRVIGITGSVGKSTTKEVVAEVLNRRYRTLKSPVNMNDEIGLPLSILKLGSGYQRAVLDMGFTIPGKIALMSEIAKPQVGVVTNIGTVHAERAGSQEALFQGKSELVKALPANGVAILNLDDVWVTKMAELTPARVFFYGMDPAAELWADEVEGLGLEGIRFRMHYKGETLHVHIPMIGQHSVHTALRAAAVGLVENLTWQEIMDGLRQVHGQLRLTAVRTENGALLLDDTYNTSPESTLAALNLLAQLGGHKVAVLGDMQELGPYEKQGHEIVGVRAAEVSDTLITVGKLAHMIAQAARRAGMVPEHIKEFESSDEAISHLQKALNEQDVVLVKGPPDIRMDRIAAALEKPS